MKVLATTLAVAAIAVVSVVSTAQAAQCTGTVRGLSNTYNEAKGSGFLAVRAGPSSRSPRLGELFNGDEVEVLSVRGKWVEIEILDGIAWVFGKYLRRENGCDGT